MPTDNTLHHAHDVIADGGTVVGVRPLVVDSWIRSLAAGVDADRATAPLVFEGGELREFRAEHPLSAVFPLLYDVLGRAAEDCDCVMAVGDTEGRLLWVCGRPSVVRQAETIHFVEGTWWDEQHAGTNAPGTALRLDAPVQIRSAEHFTRPVQRWSCAAAPIHDPETQRILGVVDVTGGADAASPLSLAMVRSAARMAEAELGRLLVVRRAAGVDAGRAGVNLLEVAALGRPDCEVRLGGRVLRLSHRHSEILAALVDAPGGLTGDQLAFEVYRSDVHSSTMRAEINRLRALLGPAVLGSRPYRLKVDVSCDWLDVAERPRGGARRHRTAPLSRAAAAPVGRPRHRRTTQRARAPAAASGAGRGRAGPARQLDPDSLGDRRPRDVGAAGAAAAASSSPLRAVSLAEVSRLRADYGISRLEPEPASGAPNASARQLRSS